MSQLMTRLAVHAFSRPDAVALVYQQQNKLLSLTYGELYQRVIERAEAFKHNASHCIGLRGENSLDWVLTDLAAMTAGIPIVPIPTFFTQAQTEHVLTQSGCDLWLDDWGQTLKSDAASSSFETLLPGTAKITFTSGSSGTPKGVCLSAEHLDEVTQQLAAVIELQTQVEKHLVMLPLSTLLENITGIYVPLWLGKTTVVLPGKEVGLVGSSHLDDGLFARVLQQQQPNSLVLTPAILQLLLHMVSLSPQLATSLEFVAVGGARVPAPLIEQAENLGIPVYEGYGLSECGSVVSLNTPNRFKAGTSGRALAHLNVRVNESQELEVSGSKALGYLGQPFTDKWLPTGDLAAIDEQGFITILGRKKNILITSFGRNISPEWLESEAQIYSPLARMLVVGEGQPHLSAWVCHSDVNAVIEAISQFNQTLPDYAQIGEVAVLSQWPAHLGWFTANGRPIRQQIPLIDEVSRPLLSKLWVGHSMIQLPVEQCEKF